MNRLFPGALLGFCLVFSLLTATTASAQLATADDVSESDYRIYHSDGTPATLDDMRQVLDGVDVVFVGELHNDPVSHYIEQRVLEAWFDTHGHAAALSLEMFSRDVQYIVDEYLTGLISDSHFQQSSSPWSNYETDYRPLVEFAKANDLAVIAANAPRRYANMVSRGGRSSLESLSDQARRYLAPLPYAAASQEYEAQWNEVMAAAMEAMRAAQEDQQEVAEGEADHAGMDHAGMDHGEMDHAAMREQHHPGMSAEEYQKMKAAHMAAKKNGESHQMGGMQHAEGHDMGDAMEHGEGGHSCPMMEEGGECKMMEGEMEDMDHSQMDHGVEGHEGMDHGEMNHNAEEHAALSHDAPAAQPQHGGGSMLDAQALWDATMAWSIADHMTRTPGAKVAHFVGGFHVESGTGTPEHLIQYRPGTRMLIISVQSVEDPSTFDPTEHMGLGDFVVLGNAALPRTYETRTR